MTDTIIATPNATMTLTPIDEVLAEPTPTAEFLYAHLTKGMKVQLLPRAGHLQSGTIYEFRDMGSNGYGHFDLNKAYPITRVTANYIRVRIESTSYDADGTSVEIPRTDYEGNPRGYLAMYKLPGADYTPPRKLGKTPTDAEALVTMPDGTTTEVISTDDPRIQWIWKDLATYADGANWCAQYDQLAVRVGIPGRARDFTISRKVGGFDITRIYKAHSKREANELFDADLTTAGIIVVPTGDLADELTEDIGF